MLGWLRTTTYVAHSVLYTEPLKMSHILDRKGLRSTLSVVLRKPACDSLTGLTGWPASHTDLPSPASQGLDSKPTPAHLALGIQLKSSCFCGKQFTD